MSCSSELQTHTSLSDDPGIHMDLSIDHEIFKPNYVWNDEFCDTNWFC